jgi:DNA adenine methylase
MKLKTFIKWSGNKSKHLRHILPHIPIEYNTYIEPFSGSGALFLSLQPGKWIINDLNKDLINCWNNIKDNPEEIINIFVNFGKKFKLMTKENKIKYCKNITSILDDLEYDVLRTSIYMLMKYCSYLGDILINNKFVFNGLNLRIYIDNKYYFLEQNNYNNILNVSDFLNNSNGHIYNKDYKEILKKSKEGDFIFLDPPYIEEHNYDFNYNKDEKLDNNFIMELYTEVQKLDKKNVKWLMTQADMYYIKNIFKKYIILDFPVYRRYKKQYVKELIIKNY